MGIARMTQHLLQLLDLSDEGGRPTRLCGEVLDFGLIGGEHVVEMDGERPAVATHVVASAAAKHQFVVPTAGKRRTMPVSKIDARASRAPPVVQFITSSSSITARLLGMEGGRCSAGAGHAL